MEHMNFFQGVCPSEAALNEPAGMVKRIVQDGRTDILPFLHDVALASWRGRLYEAWYNSTSAEICGSSLIRGRFSCDGGVNWSDPVTIVGEMGENERHFVPADLFVHQDALYALITTMSGKNLTESVELYRQRDDPMVPWEHVSNVGEGFICNTPPRLLPNGNYIVGAWMPMKEESPAFPAVLISQGSDIARPWRCVFLYDPMHPLAPKPLCPEVTVDAEGMRCVAHVRNDCAHPLVFVSEDGGDSWSSPVVNDMPINGSKMFAGRLPDGRHYLIYNHEKGRWVRTLLLMAVSEPGAERYSRVYKLLDGHDESLNRGRIWFYPSACVQNGRLHVGCTLQETTDQRSAILCSIPLDSL